MFDLVKKHREKRVKSDSGFTLIELIVVIVIIGILAAIVVFALRGSTDSARLAKCKQNGSTLIAALDSYYSATGQFPVATGTSPTVPTSPVDFAFSSNTKPYSTTDLEALVPDYLRSNPGLDDVAVFYTPKRTFNVTGGSATSTEVTLTISGSDDPDGSGTAYTPGGLLKVGDLISVTGLTSAGWNVVSARITVVTSATSIKIANTYGLTSSISSQSGTLSVAPRVAIQGLVDGCGNFGL
jgi:prepilin-type N-terminal cleavage/methylation domain-containing protein